VEFTEEQIERLRRSGIRLDAEGRFWHEGEEVTHKGLRAALFRWLDRTPDGRWILRLDEKRFVYLDIDDTPFLVRSLRWEGAKAFLLLSDGTEEPLVPESLRIRGRIAYTTVKSRFPARLSSSALATLGERVSDRDGVPELWIAERRIPIIVQSDSERE
jgi:hypothetical protein